MRFCVLPNKFSMYNGVDFMSAGSTRGSKVVPDYAPVQPVCVLCSFMGVWSGSHD